jgi:RNA polymerase sigma-70 factor (ECF subfamily)
LRAVLRDEERPTSLSSSRPAGAGDFHGRPSGRFRLRQDVLHNLVVDFRRRAGTRAAIAGWDVSRRDQQQTAGRSVRAELEPGLLDRSWAGLRATERDGGAPYYAVLRLLVDDPELSSHDLAQRLSQQLGSEFTAGNVRVVIHRARQMFADQLVAEVADSLESITRDEIEQELGELSLLRYCKSALDRHFPDTVANGGGKESGGS